MIHAIVKGAIAARRVVFALVLVLVACGLRAYATLPLDAVPDLTSVQVQVLTNAPGLSPLEVEQLVSRPVELAMAGLPGRLVTRSISRAGVSAVTVVFEDGTDLMSARTLVSQRMAAAKEAIPAGVGHPDLGPPSTGLGEIFHFVVRWPGHDTRDLRTVFDWDIARALRAVPGVVEVNAWGGSTRQIEVRLDPARMVARGVDQTAVETTLAGVGQSAGAGAIERGGEQVLVRFDGQLRTPDDVAQQVVATSARGEPVRIADVAEVVDGQAPRGSVASADDRGEIVYGMVQMLAGENAHAVTAGVRERLETIRAQLPDGVVIEPFYDRATLVDRVLSTVWRSLGEGGVVVVVVLLLFLGDLRAGLVVATMIPLSLLGAIGLMRVLGMSGNLMSLGAIDFGLVVDGAVVLVEGALATMALRAVSPSDALTDEAEAVGKPIALGVLIIALVYVPILLLEGVEGRLFRPMAWTVLFALCISLPLAFTWIPAIGSLALRTPRGEPRWVSALRVRYRKVLPTLLEHPRWAAVAALTMSALAVTLLVTRGFEFIPRLDEGDLAISVTRPPGVSVTEAVAGDAAIEHALVGLPEVSHVVVRTGSPDVATDIMGIEQSDVFVMLRPHEAWRHGMDRDRLIADFETRLRLALPGATFAFTQPIEMRTQELLGGMKSDVGIRVVGDDLPTLTRLADDVARVLASTPGGQDVRVEATTGLPTATLRPLPDRLGRLGVSTEALRGAVEALRAGRIVTQLVQGERRIPVAVRYATTPWPDREALASATVVVGPGRQAILGDLVELTIGEGPAQVGREEARRRVVVEANVRGRDLGGYVGEVKRRLEQVRRPTGYAFEVTGQYDHLVHAAHRLALVVPVTLLGIAALLYFALGSFRLALVVLANIPAAALGGGLALFVTGLPLSISAAVGFIALFGVATLNGVVLVSAANHRLAKGMPPKEAFAEAAAERLRPVLTTAAVAAIGFLPMALQHGSGAEVQRPLALVVIGGLLTATLLTLVLLPALSLLAQPKRT